MLLRFRFARVLWVVLLVCGFMVFGSGQAEAEEALASWYGPGFDGLPTASGEMFDADGLSTAHQTLPMGTELIVGYGGKTVPVTVNDRGPYLGERELDLSQGAAQELGLIQPGVDWVQVECANGGIYPDCLAADPTALPVAPAVQDASTTPTTSPVVPPVQDASAPADTPAAPGAPIVQDETSSDVHTALPGETSTGIATGLGTSPEEQMAQNGITNPNLIPSVQPLIY
jgi:rare lipoprotein A